MRPADRKLSISNLLKCLDNIEGRAYISAVLIAIDIGNSRIAMAVLAGRRIVWRHSMETADLRSSARAASFIRRASLALRGRAVEGVCIASVAPSGNRIIAEACRRVFGVRPAFIAPRDVGIKVSGYDLRQIGVDRLLSCLAAHVRYRRAAIVVDAGSCITFDAASSKGVYLGGAIVPGISMSLRALSDMTERLPLIDFKFSGRVIGRNTAESVLAGMNIGYGGLVDAVVAAMSRAMRARPLVIATGGDARVISRLSKSISRVHPDLIFEGLRIVWKNLRSFRAE